jgi:hypothetical protein
MRARPDPSSPRLLLFERVSTRVRSPKPKAAGLLVFRDRPFWTGPGKTHIILIPAPFLGELGTADLILPCRSACCLFLSCPCPEAKLNHAVLLIGFDRLEAMLVCVR